MKEDKGLESLLRTAEKIGASKLLIRILEEALYRKGLSYEQIEKIAQTFINSYEN